MALFGNKGKLSERLKNILRAKRKKKKLVDDSLKVMDSNKIYIDFLKVMAAIPGFVSGYVTSETSDDKLIKPQHDLNSSSDDVVVNNKKIELSDNHETIDRPSVGILYEVEKNIDNSHMVDKNKLDQKLPSSGNVIVDESKNQQVNNQVVMPDTAKVELPRMDYPKTSKGFANNEVVNKTVGDEGTLAAVKVEDKSNDDKIIVKNIEKNPLPSKNADLIKKENRNRINAIDVAEIKKKQQSVFGTKKGDALIHSDHKKAYGTPKIDDVKQQNVSTASEVKQNGVCQELEKSIINLIKKKLIKTVNELEILQSELYILSEVNGDSKVLNDCKKELDQVKSILCKIDKLKEQYDFLKDNYDFEYLLELGDNNLVDKIIELKDSFGNNELKAVSADYKLLDVYKYLYLKIDDLEEKTVEFEAHKKNEVEKLKERDIDFEKLKNDVYNVASVNNDYNSFVDNQNKLLREIDENVTKISSYEQVDYHIRGFNELFRNCFKYFGLLMISPLKGIIPSIATETLITGNIIKNLYNNLEWEETRKTVYEAMDYSSMIGNAISDLESTNRIVNTTLEEIVRLKIKYNDKFKKYQGDFLAYQEIMHKIGDMENKIMGNKIKIEMMRQRALEQQRLNDKKLILVKKLNERENHD